MHRAQGTELRAQSSQGVSSSSPLQGVGGGLGGVEGLCTGHRAQSTELRAQSSGGKFFKPPSGGWGWLGGCRRAMHRAQSTEHRAQSTEHRAQSSEHRAQGVSSSSPLQGVGGGFGGVEGSLKISSTFLTDP